MKVFMRKEVFKKPTVVYIITILWWLLVLYGCFRPSVGIPKIGIPHLDKIVHFLMFGGIGFFSLLSIHVYKKEKFNFNRSAFWMLMLTIILGLLIEIIQSTPMINRSFEWADLLFDSLGAGFAIWLYKRILII